MPPTPPVPSKGAIRALRHLALGTSCTVAAGAGILTEDRRRRIRTARQVYENAQTLKDFKSSRSYHVAIEAFEEDAFHPSDDAYWLPSKVAKNRSRHHVNANSRQGEYRSRIREMESSATQETGVESHYESYWLHGISSGSRPQLLEATPVEEEGPSIATRWSPPKSSTKETIRPEDLHAVDTGVAGNANGSSFSLKPSRAWAVRNLSSIIPNVTISDEMVTFLGRSDTSDGLDLAMSKLTEALEKYDGSTDGIPTDLLNIAEKIFWAASKQSRNDIREQTLTTLLRHGPIDQARLAQFEPELVLGGMIQSVKQPAVGFEVDVDLLKDAVSIFLAAVRASPQCTPSARMIQHGERLCGETYGVGLYDLTQEVFAQIDQCKVGGPPIAVQYLLKATHAKGQHDKVFGQFQQFFTKTRPNKLEFFLMGNLVSQTLVEQGDFEALEEFLRLASEMATSCNIPMSTTWFLKTIGNQWRSFKDIDETRAIFERLVPLVSSTSHPHAFYAAVMQYCFESGLDDAAMEYHRRLADAHPGLIDSPRILSRLAHAKALRADWNGLRRDLETIRQKLSSLTKSPDNSAEIAAFGDAVPTIIKAFAKSHKAGEVEQFLHELLESCKLQVTTPLFNLMIDVYAKSMEFESLLRWVEFAISRGFNLNPVSINAILSKFIRAWDFSFLEALDLYQQLQLLEKRLGTKITDARSFLILEKIAIMKTRNDDDVRRNLERLKKFGKPTSREDGVLDLEGHERDILRAWGACRYQDVVAMFEDAERIGLKLGEHSLRLAVKSSLKSENAEGLEKATSLTKAANKRGQNVSSSIAVIFEYRMKKIDLPTTNAECVVELVRENIKVMEAHGIEVSSNVITTILDSLVQSGNAQKAIDIWHSWSNQRPEQPSPSIATLTVLLRAFIDVRQKDGIRWIIGLVSQQNILPDTRFYKAITKAHNAARAKVQGVPEHAGRNWEKCLSQARTKVFDMRESFKQQKKSAKYHTIRVVENSMKRQLASTKLMESPKGLARVQGRDVSVGDHTLMDTEPVSIPRVAASGGR